MLRRGQPQAAHACMGTACYALSPGSGPQARQLSYLASTQMWIGAHMRAESLLMTSLHMAHNASDHTRAWHALARSQFLALDRHTDAQTATDVAVSPRDYVPAP